jgi:hypothetical protein
VGSNQIINMSKTLKLIEHYYKVLREQDDQNDDTMMQPDGELPPQDVMDAPQETPDETMPLSSEGENRYIEDLIDAALYEPTSDDARMLTNLQSVMKMKRYKNAREEILPSILNIIRPATDESDIRSDLDRID